MPSSEHALFAGASAAFIRDKEGRVLLVYHAGTGF